MATLTITKPTALQCGTCDGLFIAPEAGSPVAVCVECRRTLSISDFLLDPDEVLVWLPHPSGVHVLTYFTEGLLPDEDD